METILHKNLFQALAPRANERRASRQHQSSSSARDGNLACQIDLFLVLSFLLSFVCAITMYFPWCNRFSRWLLPLAPFGIRQSPGANVSKTRFPMTLSHCQEYPV